MKKKVIPMKARQRAVGRRSNIQPSLVPLMEQRLGRTSEDRLRWVVAFVRRDLRTLRPEEVKALGEDLRGLLPETWTLTGAEAVQEGEVNRLHRDLGEALRGFVKKSPKAWDLPSRGVCVWRDSPERPLHFTGRGPQSQGIPWGVINLLQEARDNLLACAECGEPFVAWKRQEYCSPICSQKARDGRKKLRKEKRDA